MKCKDGIKLKFKWRRILSPKQCFYDFKYMPGRFTWYSDEVGTVIMWIVFILCSPFIALYFILSFPIRLIKFFYKAKTMPKELMKDNRNFDYFCEVINQGETNND